MTTGCESGSQMVKLAVGTCCIGYGFFFMNLIVVLIGVALLVWMAFGD